MVRNYRKRSSLVDLKKFIYLISPNTINKSFYDELPKVLSSNKVKFFQIRIKKRDQKEIISVSKKIKKITKKYNVKLIINDSVDIAKTVNADGCHLGQNDDNIEYAKKKLKKKIIGMTCHGSKKLCLRALKKKASYLALGSFFKSKLKQNARKTKIKILKWAKKEIKIPIVAIGGINDKNYKKLIKAGANYIAISSFIWDNPDLKPEKAIRKFK